jgi:hypothetical protein
MVRNDGQRGKCSGNTSRDAEQDVFGQFVHLIRCFGAISTIFLISSLLSF